MRRGQRTFRPDNKEIGHGCVQICQIGRKAPIGLLLAAVVIVKFGFYGSLLQFLGYYLKH